MKRRCGSAKNARTRSSLEPASPATRNSANSPHEIRSKANFIDASRHLYVVAEADKYVTAQRNPTSKLRKPRRHKSLRRALTHRQLLEINTTAASTGTDPALDSLMLRLHTETACRRGGALALRPCDVNEELCTVRLREKGGTTREQPISPTLAADLLAHVRARPGARFDEGLLRHRDGTPITRSRYAALWSRLHQHLPWIGAMGITAHRIRYTTLTWVERSYGYRAASARDLTEHEPADSADRRDRPSAPMAFTVGSTTSSTTSIPVPIGAPGAARRGSHSTEFPNTRSTQAGVAADRQGASLTGMTSPFWGCIPKPLDKAPALSRYLGIYHQQTAFTSDCMQAPENRECAPDRRGGRRV